MQLGNHRVFFSHNDNGTSCSVRTIDDAHVSNVRAKKNPKDTFSKAKGRAVSLQRAIISLPRNERRNIWDGNYHERTQRTQQESLLCNALQQVSLNN